MRVLLLVLAVALPGPALAEDPWQVLEVFRQHLRERSPLRADFTQAFVAEGFTTAEEESGHLAISLPDCMRWDYDEPYPKSFLLCGDVVHYWNPGEDEGHIEEIDADREPGLDLLLVEVDELRRRYEAEVHSGGRRGVVVTLRPREENEYVVEATLELDRLLEKLEVLRYLDPDGNRTEFRITAWKSGVPNGIFNPPKDVEWLEEY